MAFVTAKAALEFRAAERLGEQVREKEAFVAQYLKNEIEPLGPGLHTRGIGLIWGIDVAVLGEEAAGEIARNCFKNGLILERAGRNDTVIKIMPPLTISMDNLKRGCETIKESISKVCYSYSV
ncbi:Diaminobutyrate--2-oxoglutarate transaminase [compost metagenome]